MDISFERGKNRTDEWFTPKWIIEALNCQFDLDPCTSYNRPFDIAPAILTKENDGLISDWFGRVWCNPPYTPKLIKPFISKLAKHGNGIALIFNRMDNALWHNIIFPTADSILIMRGRVRFIDQRGKEGDSAGCGSVLVAWGKDNSKVIEDCGIQGKFIKLK